MDFEVSHRRPTYMVPSYSLTGDIISFARCGLQYRYSKLGRLPATRPAQLWFGQFIHGVLEEGFRRYTDIPVRKRGKVLPFSDNETREILDLVTMRLRKQGLSARNFELESQGRYRAEVSLRDLAPRLYPLITEAEVKLTGTRDISGKLSKAKNARNIEKYEMVGVVDVITELALGDKAFQENELVELIAKDLDVSEAKFEVIVDYKGMRRPTTGSKSSKKNFHDLYRRQIQTYSYLREVQIQGRRVAAGVLIWINELSPSWADVEILRNELRSGSAEIRPVPGSRDEQVILAGRTGRGASTHPDLSLEFRLKRAVMIVPVNHATIQLETEKFDDYVVEIEGSMSSELKSGNILESWMADTSDPDTCTACDFRITCPKHHETAPRLPGQ